MHTFPMPLSGSFLLFMLQSYFYCLFIILYKFWPKSGLSQQVTDTEIIVQIDFYI